MKYEPNTAGNLSADALLEVSWGDSRAIFVLECKSLSTPKAFQAGINRLKATALPMNYLPMLFVPFLNEQQLQELEREEISGIDLCGNGVVIAPRAFSIYRTGGKNRFTSSASIKNIYRKNSSMVGRIFLFRSRYETVQNINEEINRRNLLVNYSNKKAMSLSTVSKALKTLEEDLIISRKEGISLLQPDKLLQKLGENYTPPEIKKRISFKVPADFTNILESLSNESQALSLPIVATGMSSVNRYALMQRGDLLSIYCPRIDALLQRLSGSEDRHFPNLELIETADETVYFGGRYEDCFWWASPVQVYLELMAGDKRDRETATQVKSYIFDNLQKAYP